MEDFDSLKVTELTLRLPGADVQDKSTPPASLKRAFSQVVINEEESCRSRSSMKLDTEHIKERDDDTLDAPAQKAQVVGWPPVRAHMMLSSSARKKEGHGDLGGGGIYVKVSMDGAPFLRKVDLKICKGYKDLKEALQIMFKCVSLGEGENCDGSDYAITYEDKDGDWMLVGDVPWEMFISSCKRMRIMNGAEARGLSL